MQLDLDWAAFTSWTALLLLGYAIFRTIVCSGTDRTLVLSVDQAKVNNTSQIGLGITHRLRQGITLSLSTMIDGKNFNQGGHKLGLGFELEA